MTDVEAATERDIHFAIQAARKSDISIWVAGFWAARVVGTYQYDGTKAIADRCGKSTSTVENWAHAYWLYDEFRIRFGVISVGSNAGRRFTRALQNLRKSLSPSHFWTAWELRGKYELTDAATLRHLQQMLDYKENGDPYSTDVLRQEVETEKNGGGATWKWWMPRVTSMIESVLRITDLPREWKEWFERPIPR